MDRFTSLTYAFHLASRGKQDEVEELLRDRARQCIESLGEEAAESAFAVGGLALCLVSRRKADEAEQECRRWVRLSVGAHGAGAPRSLWAALRSADWLWSLGRQDAAREIIDEALVAGRGRAESPDASPTDLGRYARFLLGQARDDDVFVACLPGEHCEPNAALELALQAVEQSERKDADLLTTLAMAYDASGDYANAVAVQREALQAMPKEALARFPLERQLVKYLLHHGDSGAALGHLREAYATHRENGAEDSFDVANRMFDDAWLLVSEGQYEYGEVLARRFIEIFSKGPWTGHSWWVAAAEVLVGRCLAASGRLEEAESYLLGGIEGILDNPFVFPIPYRTQALEWMVEFYEDWGKPDQAARWREEILW